MRKIQSVVKKYKFGEEPTDFNFWQTKSVDERVSALEMLRDQILRNQDGTRQRLQRIYRVVKQVRS